MKNSVLRYLLIAYLVWSCGKSEKYNNESAAESAVPPSAPPAMEKFTAAAPDSSLSVNMIGNSNDSLRMFIKKIDMRFRVKNVFQASLKTEDLCKKYDGFIVLSDLKSNNLYTETKPISEDSSIEVIHFNVENIIKLRVPVEKSDSLIRELYALIDYLDFKTISAEDVGLQFFHNKKKMERREKFEKNVRKHVKNSNVQGENIILGRKDEVDESLIENMRVLDEVRYSTITLNMYQREQIKTTVISNNKSIDEYKPGFFSQLFEAIKRGWDLLKELVLFFISIWPIILLIVLLIFFIRKYRKRKLK